MADLSDITQYLEDAITAAVYPNGTSQPSIGAIDVRIYQGWPMPDQLDRDMSGTILSGTPPVVKPRAGGPVVNVSIFPLPGMNVTPYQIQDETYVISQPTYGLTVSGTDHIITVTGTPGTGEYVTLIINKQNVYSAVGATGAAIISALMSDILVQYPTATSTDTTITLPLTTFSLVVRQGGVGVMGKVTHRQRQSIMVTIWAPNNRARTILAAAIDNVLKQTNRITLPDTSQALICYNRTSINDDHQMTTIYRRDLIYDVEYATVEQFPGYVVTSIDTSIANYNNTAIQPAVT